MDEILLLGSTSDSGRPSAPTLGLFIVGIALLAGGVMVVFRWRDYWHGQHAFKIAKTGVIGDRWSRGFQSVYPSGAVLPLIFGGAIVGSYIAPKASGIVADVVEVVATILWFGTIPATLLIAFLWLFNWPRFLVPPHARDFNGVFGSWVMSIFRKATNRRSS